MTVAVLEEIMKICTRCGIKKPVSEFGKDRTAGDGFNRQCRGCVQGCQQMRQIEIAERHRQFCKIHKVEIEERKRKHDRANSAKAIAAREYRRTFEGCLHSRFAAMKSRCDNLEDKDYVYYGARGIRCLFTSVDEFIDYIIRGFGLLNVKDLVIHRIDPDGHYEPGNIIFVTPAEHARLHKELRNTV